jgi:hypothetical protein
MTPNNYENFTKLFEIKPHDLLLPDKTTLPQVRNAMYMNDNIRKNHNNMVLVEGCVKTGVIVVTLLTAAAIFKAIEPNIIKVINTVKVKNKEVEEDRKNSEEE